MVRMTTVGKRLALMTVFDGGGGQSRQRRSPRVRGPSAEVVKLWLVDFVHAIVLLFQGGGGQIEGREEGTKRKKGQPYGPEGVTGSDGGGGRSIKVGVVMINSDAWLRSIRIQKGSGGDRGDGKYVGTRRRGKEGYKVAR